MKPNHKENATNPDSLAFNPEFLSDNLLLKMAADSPSSMTQSVVLGISLKVFFSTDTG